MPSHLTKPARPPKRGQIPKKILYLSSAGDIAGAEVSLLHLLRHLDRRKYQPHVVCCQSGTFPDLLRSEGIPCEVIPLRLSRRALLYPSSVIHNLVQMMTLSHTFNEPGVSLVHVNDTLAQKFLFLPLLGCRKPLVYHLRNYEWKRLWVFKLLAQKRTYHAIAIAEAIKKHFQELSLFPENRLSVIHGAVNPKFLTMGVARTTTSTLKKELSLKRRDRLIGLSARFDVWKGHFTFLRAAERILENRPEVHFVIVGDIVNAELFPYFVEYKAKVLHYASQARLAYNVHFLGWRNDIPEILRSLDVLVCPSENEPFPQTVLEALAARVPVIAADSGGIPEIIEHEQNGLLFQTGNDAALASCLSRVLDNPALALKLAAAGRRTVEREFMIERNVQATEQIYESLIA